MAEGEEHSSEVVKEQSESVAAANLKTEMKLSHIKAYRKAKALLTTEQVEKMKKGMGK